MKNKLIYLFRLSFCILFVSLLWPFAKGQQQSNNDFFDSPKINSIVNEIQIRKGVVRPGLPFSGRTESFVGVGDPKIVGRNWTQFHRFQALCNNVFGNDLRTLGLWKFNIPTLFQYSPLRDPFLFFFTTQVFSNSKDTQNKNLNLLTQPNPKMLGDLGVKFIITDFKIDNSDLKYLTEIKFPKDKHDEKNTWWADEGKNPWLSIEAFYLYEILKPNLGTQSPKIFVLKTTSPSEILDKYMSETIKNKHKLVAVINEDLNQSVSSATDAKFLYTPKGFKIQAKSEGFSALLLPITFSSCLNFTNSKSNGNQEVKIIRANLTQTLITFNNQIDGELEYLSSPMYNPNSIWTDFIEAKKLFSLSKKSK